MINAFLFVLFLAGEALSVLVSLFRVTDIVICDTWGVFVHENVICVAHFSTVATV